MKQYYKFKEHCDNEGETWFFYIPVDGNEKAKEAIDELFKICEMESFEFTGDTLTENEVDTLVKHSESGYMDFHNKLSGVIDIDKINLIKSDYQENLIDYWVVVDYFYKGKIEDMMIGGKKD